jgi:pantoate--beta-alanine ligase
MSATTPLPSHPSTVAVARTVAEVRDAVAAFRSDGRPVALVPTMGALHDGHLSLLRLAGAGGHAVVMSLFVNPTQFGPSEDLSSYPRDEAGDVARAADAGTDLVFAPSAGEVYPEGFATTVSVSGPASPLEGAIRPHHFAGVATVVAKLLLAVRPDRAVFGRKDAQQVAVIRRMMRDLHLDDIELVVGPIVREPDGLAMSSRNRYLGPEDRAASLVLRRALDRAREAVAAGETDPRELEALALAELASEPRCSPDYACVVDSDTFRPVTLLDAGSLLCVAGRVGPARLIDNDHLPVPTHR